jgi:glutamate 5-kinase
MIPIVVKLGSQTILDESGRFDSIHMRRLLAQMIHLETLGFRFILVSSGAVACGRAFLPPEQQHFQDLIQQRQVLSSIGQGILIRSYNQLLEIFGYTTAQILVNREDFKSRSHYENIRRVMAGLLNVPSVLPIVNENDTTAITNLMFTDNDELSSLIAGIINAKHLVILTSTDGVYDRPPTERGAQLIHHIAIEDPQVKIQLGSKTQSGRGGMGSKLASAKKAASFGVMTHIANAHTDQILIRLLEHREENLGTLVTGSCRLKGAKRWLPYSPPPSVSIFVDQALEEHLKSYFATSILPIGIQKIEGDFIKDDLVGIRSSFSETLIGVGLAEYSSHQLRPLLGHPQNRPILRYDRFWIYE